MGAWSGRGMSEAEALALQQAFVVRNRGLTQYEDSNLQATIDEFTRARELAAVAHNVSMEDESRFWLGVTVSLTI